MPVDYELFFTGSPPLFRHNFNKIADYRYCNPFTKNVYSKLTQEMPVSIPLRPILIVRSDNSPEENETSSIPSPTKIKKRVVFADDKGLMLAHVKIMTEPSDCPPAWKDEFLDQVTRGASATVAPDKWEPMFPQPASDYVEFRKRIESNCVSLENVIVRDCEETVLGTVKVRNISFSKEVFVRVTYDAWVTYTDVEGVYVPSGTEGTAVYDLFDTFSFTLKIPPHSSRSQCMEFCVCYKCSGQEYWDNNSGSNYKLVSTPSAPQSPPPSTNSNGLFMLDKVDTLYKARMENWTEFASWQHLVNDSPYW